MSAATQSSFYWPMRLAPQPQSSGLFAVYAWCREVDDIVDGPGQPEDKAEKLLLWRKFFSDPHHATAMAPDEALLAATVSAAMAAHRLDPAVFMKIIDGFEMDLTGEMRAPSAAMLADYSACVAGAPGRLCLAIMGWRGPEADAFAHALGEAVQYTNILRDVDEDAAMGRMYVPREALDAAGIVAAEPSIVIADKRFANAWLALALMAEAKFHHADALLPPDRRAGIRPVLAMMAVYRALWRRLRRRGWRPGQARVSVPKWQASLLALRAAWLA
ncbi:MAG: squalene/phytoene synthase family protein [Rhodospirillaceae bacterium]|nr:squalene/phytoene synthase family protein [Rhodospirillaceae bacterium]